MKDDRDGPQTVTDVNGDMFYITRNGTRIPVKDVDHAKEIKDIEEHIRWEYMFPMGMK